MERGVAATEPEMTPAAHRRGVRNTPCRGTAATKPTVVTDPGESTWERQDSKDNAPCELMPRILSRENMLAAWQAVRRNAGAAGVDRLQVEALPEWLKARWEQTTTLAASGQTMNTNSSTQPPDAEPHVRWCGRTAGATPPPTRFFSLSPLQTYDCNLDCLRGEGWGEGKRDAPTALNHPSPGLSPEGIPCGSTCPRRGEGIHFVFFLDVSLPSSPASASYHARCPSASRP